MKRLDALTIIRNLTLETPVVATCGLTSRELASLGTRDNHLYMLNSMGLAGPVALGLALGLDRKVCAIEGDGGLLMGLNFLATVGAERPEGLILIVLDNGAHCSTGGQPTAARVVDLGVVANAMGLAVSRASTPAALRAAMRSVLDGQGPALLHVKISTEAAVGVDYYQADPPTITHRFRTWLAGRSPSARPGPLGRSAAL